MSPSFGAQDPIMAIVGDPRIQAPNPPSETTKPLNNWWKQLLCAVSCCLQMAGTLQKIMAEIETINIAGELSYKIVNVMTITAIPQKIEQ